MPDPRRVLLSTAGPGATCSRVVPREEVAEDLRRELGRWLAPDVAPAGLDALTLAGAVTQEVRWVGHHFLDREHLAALAAIRTRHGGRDAFLDAFLDCALDKHDGRYWNRTYLQLPVLELLIDGEHATLDPAALSALLAADIVRHELCAASRGREVAFDGRPDSRTLRTRVRHALRFMTAHLGGGVAVDLLGCVAHEPEAGLPALLAHLPVPPDPLATEWLAVSAHPVSVVHDEYFFMRVLQAHELVFTVIAADVRQAIVALRDGEPAAGLPHLAHATALLDGAGSLFRMVATMRAQAFHTFRDFTQGASAIQSEQYKRFEVLCGPPPPGRIGAAAFDSVPAVQAEARAGHDSLTAAYRDACGRDRRDDAALAAVADGLRTLEDSHHRWKTTHLSLATRMLGDARGSGYTSGVPYLRAWVEHRLFWGLPQIGVTAQRSPVAA